MESEILENLKRAVLEYDCKGAAIFKMTSLSIATDLTKVPPPLITKLRELQMIENAPSYRFGYVEALHKGVNLSYSYPSGSKGANCLGSIPSFTRYSITCLAR